MSFPNRTDLQRQTEHLKTVVRKEMDSIRADISKVTSRVELLEKNHIELQKQGVELVSKQSNLEQGYFK